MIYDVLVAGTGVIGAMIARELTRYDLTVCMVEKENDVACGASKANSGIIHGGYDPEPGTLKAKLNTLGVDKLYATAEALHVPFKRNGSLVCAFSAEEDATVKALYERGQINGIPQLKVLTGEEARALEPELSGAVTSALHVPTAGIICPYDLTIAAAGNAMDNGAELVRNFEITAIDYAEGLFTLTAADGRTLQGKRLFNCAGTGSDKLAKLAGDDFFTIIPRAGEYMLLDKTEGSRVRHTIFQVPTKEGKGILVSPTVDGNLLTGPTAAVCDSRETTPEGLQTVGKLSAKSVPGVNFRSVITSFTGVRASEKNGDFIIEKSKNNENLIHVAAIDSPGLTACVAIAEYAVGLLGEMKENPNFCGDREDPHAFRHMTDEEKDAYIKAHPDYGKIVCRCETVSEGEIRSAIRRNPPALDLDGVKRRTRSGMGRCQGGFCGPYVMQLLAEENGVPKEAITKNGGDSYMVTGKL
ncbi:MAG: NAD(P)/FAD-dependent oxidoreductase [Ruminococcaceae bacterium]|nr:NAD(P)/FAD-dependent oxidoreductase [Oscillospiraceae bacterium]